MSRALVIPILPHIGLILNTYREDQVLASSFNFHTEVKIGFIISPVFHLEVLSEELQHRLVTPQVLGLDPVLAQIGASGHPAVNLVLEDLDVLRDLEGVLELLDVLGGLVSRGQEDEGDLQAFGVGGVHHGRVDAGGDGEGVGVGLDSQGNDLSAPAVLNYERTLAVTSRERGRAGQRVGPVTYTDDTKAGQGRVLLLEGLNVIGKLGSNLIRRVLAEEFA